MDEFKDKISLEICEKDGEVSVRTVLPVSRYVDTDVASVLTYLASHYDVLYFCHSICDGGLDCSVSFRLKDCFFDAKRFALFLLSI